MQTQNQSAFSQIISSPTLWGLFIAFVLGIVKIADAPFLGTVAFQYVEAIIIAISGILHIPVLFTANASLASLQASKEASNTTQE